jgi:hypothetical protein
MPVDYVERVRRLDWHGLRALWRRIEAGTTGWPPGKAMEHLVLRAFELSGAQVRWPYRVYIGGELVEQIDGAVYVDSLCCLVECKDTRARTDAHALATLRNQLLRRHAGAIGLFFSRAGFTGAASTLAQYLAPQTILLWTGVETDAYLEQENFCAVLRSKYRHSVETGDAAHVPEFEEVA